VSLLRAPFPDLQLELGSPLLGAPAVERAGLPARDAPGGQKGAQAHGGKGAPGAEDAEAEAAAAAGADVGVVLGYWSARGEAKWVVVGTKRDS
jgi:hypothetical protein